MSPPMRCVRASSGPPRGASWATLLLLAGCGQVSFGEDLDPADAGVPEAGPPADAAPPDAGPPDLGSPDLGPAPDLGCVPVELPSGPPEDWPFASSASGYREVFWSWAVPELGCSGSEGSSSCHGASESPLIPFPSEVDARYEQGIEALWPLVQAGPRLDEAMPTGRLWRHMPSHPDHVGPSFFGAVPARLDALVQQARDCRVAAFLRDPPDAGSDCGGDAGTGADGGSGLCYCPLPDAGMLMTSFCAP